ncbi:MAG: VWA domain-containing protein [Pyrinomonadaceae bacterium]|nr:VWA domain-containing protein [Acidobacteriota bacterium]MBK7933901.1 VWA domain-containing protein [Acidobacteriota bacterium]MBP7376948.1 VWA domain-containing protein [Pyrinomonadaceae bacterium]
MFLAVFRFAFGVTLLIAVLLSSVAPVTLAQSKPQRPDTPTGDGKKNNRPKQLTEEEKKAIEDAKKREEEEKNAIIDDTVERVDTNLVNVDAVVINKKTGGILTGLKKENFAIFENGVKQSISSFSTPEAPITVTLVVEYSKWTELLGSAAGGRFEPGIYEVIKPVAYFLSNFIKAPNDYASVIAFDMRPTPITDFTNDPQQLRKTVDILLRNNPAFRENNLWDAIKFTLLGGKGDSVVLDQSGDYDKGKQSDYSGMANLKAKRKAIILVASGIDTFSKSNYAEARRIVQEAGVPVYIISTGNLFYKRFEQYLGPLDDISGTPGRLTFLQAQNSMNTIAKESGGKHFPMTFEGEVPGYLQEINALMRNQYSLAYDLAEKRPPGSRNKLEVKVDVDGDGVFDDKVYQVQHRPYYIAPGKQEKKKK